MVQTDSQEPQICMELFVILLISVFTLFFLTCIRERFNGFKFVGKIMEDLAQSTILKSSPKMKK